MVLNFLAKMKYLLKYYKFCPVYHITFDRICKASKIILNEKIRYFNKKVLGKLCSLWITHFPGNEKMY